MSRNKRVDDAVNQYEQRLRDTRRKLQDALARLIADQSKHPNSQEVHERFTIAALAREAGISRNAIYTNHRALLDELRHAALTVSPKATGRESRLVEQQATIDAMKLNERRMITENAVLLKRAQDAEVEVARHRNHSARLVAERDAVLRPVSIASLKHS
jgi:DNA polymerase III epsilon subunit-like protein